MHFLTFLASKKSPVLWKKYRQLSSTVLFAMLLGISFQRHTCLAQNEPYAFCFCLIHASHQESYYRAEYKCMWDLGDDAWPSDSIWFDQCFLYRTTAELSKWGLSGTMTMMRMVLEADLLGWIVLDGCKRWSRLTFIFRLRQMKRTPKQQRLHYI